MPRSLWHITTRLRRLRIVYRSRYEGVACLRFRYHMYGFHVNELSVTNRYHGNAIRLWKALGAHGNRWNEASARVDLRNNDQVGISKTLIDEEWFNKLIVIYIFGMRLKFIYWKWKRIILHYICIHLLCIVNIYMSYFVN